MKAYLVIEVNTDYAKKEIKDMSFEEVRKVVMDEAEICNEKEFKAVDCFETRPVELSKPSVLKEGDCPKCFGCGNVMVSHPNQCYYCGGSGKQTKGGTDELGFKVDSTTSFA